jgi:nucleoside-triphosphatase
LTPRALLLTGPPGIGKTTVIRRVAAGLAGRRVRGFTTEEIREAGERQGFAIEAVGGERLVLAHVKSDSRHRLGRYGVETAALGRIVDSALALDAAADVYLVDEIGKMECLSPSFVGAITRLLDSANLLVATVALRGAGFIEEVKRRPGTELWTVTRASRDALPERVIAWLASRSA